MNLTPMTADSANEPLESSTVFDLYDAKAKAYNHKISGSQHELNTAQLIQQAAQVIAQNPELVMAL
ncbi:hypothetical protein Lmor_1718 [Legionella moravica]|uniref:Uncharacterized protein n=1 Tax=Legionella moravica TaxID=39962 RepID=A0A378K361_9GAMM|nr:hypothetical protein [Legionella moravica]KTD34321.1 hypothetical protein Lmor_1718 [Legionella moravica]STX64038.1 Uncharacterised protein [Legionella moravica]